MIIIIVIVFFLITHHYQQQKGKHTTKQIHSTQKNRHTTNIWVVFPNRTQKKDAATNTTKTREQYHFFLPLVQGYRLFADHSVTQHVCGGWHQTETSKQSEQIKANNSSQTSKQVSK